MTSSAQYAPAGILGAVIFVITAVVQLLRERIVETEALAAQRGLDLRNLVRAQRLHHPASAREHRRRRRRGSGSAHQRVGGQACSAASRANRRAAAHVPIERLGRAARRWRARLSIRSRRITSADGSTTVKPHFAPLGGGRDGGVVIFLEDTSLIAERVQQAKLAALGRLSASIAHEIRNPIGAMSHAGQLLARVPGASAATSIGSPTSFA